MYLKDSEGHTNNRAPLPRRARLLIVGAFPSPGSNLHGGVVADCRALLSSDLGDHLDLVLIDSTGRSVPPPPLYKRVLYALPRMAGFWGSVRGLRPDSAMLFASSGFSFLEKAALANVASRYGARTFIYPVGGALIEACERSALFAAVCRGLLPSNITVLCQGSRWQEFFHSVLRVPRKQCLQMPNWTATPALLDAARRRVYRRTPCTLLFIGWLDITKGVMDFLHAISRLIAEGAPAFKVLIAGQGHASELVLDYVKTHGLEAQVSLLGWIDGEQKQRTFEAADVFVLPSYFEGLPNSMIEAMASGLPVVVTPVGNIRDAVQHGKQGLLVAPKDVGGLTAALNELIGDWELRARLGTNAHQTARERYSTSAAADRLVALVSQRGDC
jgi:glycosyltransferase involved in cell wall biosynthesis